MKKSKVGLDIYIRCSPAEAFWTRIRTRLLMVYYRKGLYSLVAGFTRRSTAPHNATRLPRHSTHTDKNKKT